MDKETRENIFEVENNFVNALKSKDFEKASGYLTTAIKDTTSTKWLKLLYSQFQNNATDEIEHRLRPKILDKWVIKKDSAKFLVKESRKLVDIEGAKEMYEVDERGVTFEKFIPLLAMDGILPTFKDTVDAYHVKEINNKHYLDLDLSDYKQFRQYVANQRLSFFDNLDIRYIIEAESFIVSDSYSTNLILNIINNNSYAVKVGFDVVLNDKVYASINDYNVNSKDTAVLTRSDYKTINELNNQEIKEYGKEVEDGDNKKYIIKNNYVVIKDTTITFTEQSWGAVFKMALNETGFDPDQPNIMKKVF